MMMPLHFLPAPIAFDEDSGAFHVTADDGVGTIEISIGRDALEHLSKRQGLSKDAALTILVKNQSRLLAAADRLLTAAPHGARAIAITAADLKSA